MRLIDEKGRLFGFINLIDLAVLSILILLVGGFIYKSEIKNRGAGPQVKEITVRAYFPFVHPEVAPAVQVGDRLVAGTDYVNATIEKVEVKPANYSSTRQDGTRILTTDPFRKDVFVEIKGNAPVTGAEVVLAGQKIRIGREDFVLKSFKYELKGTILGLDIKDIK